MHPNSIKNVATPGMDDHLLKPEDFEELGNLAKDAAKVIMKALYGARLVRYELLWQYMQQCTGDLQVDKSVW